MEIFSGIFQKLNIYFETGLFTGCYVKNLKVFIKILEHARFIL